jgi:hypothetical protein
VNRRRHRHNSKRDAPLPPTSPPSTNFRWPRDRARFWQWRRSSKSRLDRGAHGRSCRQRHHFLRDIGSPARPAHRPATATTTGTTTAVRRLGKSQIRRKSFRPQATHPAEKKGASQLGLLGPRKISGIFSADIGTSLKAARDSTRAYGTAAPCAESAEVKHKLSSILTGGRSIFLLLYICNSKLEHDCSAGHRVSHTDSACNAYSCRRTAG